MSEEQAMTKEFFDNTGVLLGRSLRHILRSPDTIITTAVMPIAFLLLFVYVFGGAIEAGSGSYVDYLLPGILLITIASGDLDRKRDPRPARRAAGRQRHLDGPRLVRRDPRARLLPRHAHLPPPDRLNERSGNSRISVFSFGCSATETRHRDF
jgi:hypothetical protein